MLKGTRREERLDFGRYDWIGFDMDHTLAKYHLGELYRLIFNAVVKYLQAEHGDLYPRGLFQGLQYCNDFATKGTILDVAKGNFVNLNSDGLVCCVRHGKGRHLNEQEIDSVYGEQRVFEFYEYIKVFKKDYELFVPFTSPFGIPAAQVLGTLIEYVDKNGGPPYVDLVRHVFGGLNHNYDPTSLEKCRGLFFPALTAEPSRYLVKASEHTIQFMRDCRKRGQKILLMTNSKHDFTQVVMDYVVGPNWKNEFDLIITAAKKPWFFKRDDTPFTNIQGIEVEPTFGRVLVGGNWRTLAEKLGIGAKPHSMLYFGDDLHGDVAALSNTNSGWDGVAVVEELGDDIHANIEHVFHCPKASLENFQTEWFEAIERAAVLCIPDVSSFTKSQTNGVLENCWSTVSQGKTLWYPYHPRSLL